MREWNKVTQQRIRLLSQYNHVVFIKSTKQTNLKCFEIHFKSLYCFYNPKSGLLQARKSKKKNKEGNVSSSLGTSVIILVCRQKKKMKFKSLFKFSSIMGEREIKVAAGRKLSVLNRILSKWQTWISKREEFILKSIILW